jgi:hypothetical protein
MKTQSWFIEALMKIFKPKELENRVSATLFIAFSLL